MIIPSALEPVTITLYRNVPFDNKYTDHYFRPTFKKQGSSLTNVPFYVILRDNANYDKTTLVGTFNFNYANGLATNITLEVDAGYDSANYLVAKTNDNIFYYFITNVIILNHSNINGKISVKYELEIDAIATYQDNILSGLKTYPLEVERKHCQRYVIGSSYTIPYCCDLISDEPMISNCNPNIIKEIIKPDMNVEYLSQFIINNTNMVLEDINWLYISATEFDDYKWKMQKYAGLDIPNITLCIPLVEEFVVVVVREGQSPLIVTINVQKFISDYYENVGNYTSKVSPYPPFDILRNSNVSYDGHTLTITVDSSTVITSDVLYECYIGDSNFYVHQSGVSKEGYMMITKQGKPYYDYNKVPILDIYNRPTTSTNRDYKYELKSSFSPYKKYMLMAQYGEPLELHPELVYAKVPPISATIKKDNNDDGKTATYLSLTAYATTYGGDITFSVFPYFNTADNDNNTSSKYKEINKGFIVSPNYIYPIAQDAFKTFQQTQGNQFTTQKVGQVIGSAITIIGGLASLGSGNVMGGVAIAGGVMGIATGIAGASAKYSDLRNTPDTLSNVGGSAVHDYSIGNTFHPYVAIYELTPNEQEMINDYFYEYGYNVQRCCYFNDELYPSNYTSENWVDERIFTRNTFNYVKLSEDVTNKINDNVMPFIVKQKIANILKNGIRFWTFFDKVQPNDIIAELNAKLYKKDKENAEVY